MVENNEGVESETFEVNTCTRIVYEKVNLEQRSVVPKFCESDIVMPFAANSSPKTSSSCVKNLEGSERSQSTISRKLESRELNQFY